MNHKKLDELNPDELRPLPKGSSGWGLYDTKTDTWMGSSDGPVVYGHHVVAQLASQITDTQLQQPEGQTKPRFYKPSPMRERSRHKVRCSGEEAIRRLERGP